MILSDLIDLLAGPDRIIIQNVKGEMLFCGFVGILRENDPEEDVMEMNVIKIRLFLETRHVDWNELKLKKPIQPDTKPDFMFKDMEQRLYYRITIGTQEEMYDARLDDYTDLSRKEK